MAKRNKVVFKAEIDGEEKEVAVLRPTPAQVQEGMRVYNKAWAQAVKDGCLLREALDNYLKEQGIWGDQQEAELRAVVDKQAELENKLTAGGITKAQGREIALQLRDVRVELRNLLGDKTAVENNTVQMIAENARFDYFVSVCTVYNDNGERIFSSVEEYKERADGEEPWIFRAGNELHYLIYNLDPDYDKNLVENKFLKKYGFVNDDYALIDKDGNLVARNGKRIDKEGYYLSPDGTTRCDINGNIVEKRDIETAVFYDD